MVTERELHEAIAECEEEPASFTSIKKLASLYIVYDHLYGTKPDEKRAHYKNYSEFLQATEGKDVGAVLNILDELMQTLEVLYPKAYESVLNEIKKLP